MRAPPAILAFLIGLVTSCHPTTAVDPSKAQAFALLTAVQPASGGRLQRLTLPPRVMAAVQREDLGDLRLFDGHGRVIPLALLDGETTKRLRRSVDLRVYPVVGPGSDFARSGLSIRVEGNGVARAVTVDQSTPPGDPALPPAAALLDTRGLRDPVDAIVLQADIPAARPVTLTLLSSADLKDWEPLAQKVLFRPGDGRELLGGSDIVLNHIDLRDRYVGISWGGASGVRLTGARAITAAVAAPARAAISTNGLALDDAHELRFDLPSGIRPSAFRVTSSGADGVIPLRLFARSGEEQPWTLLAVATLQPDRGSSTLGVAGPRMTSYRLEADSRTAGFSAAPRVELLFEPVELLAAVSGTPPYRLAAGQAGAAPNFLSIAEIAPQVKPADLAKLPEMALATAGEPAPIITLRSGAADGPVNLRKFSLWAALLLGTLVLAFAAFRLFRANSIKLD